MQHHVDMGEHRPIKQPVRQLLYACVQRAKLPAWLADNHVHPIVLNYWSLSSNKNNNEITELETFGLVFQVYMVGYTHACGCLKLTLLKESNSGKFAGHLSERKIINATLSTRYRWKCVCQKVSLLSWLSRLCL